MSYREDAVDYWSDLTRAEQGVSGSIALFAAVLLVGLVTGGLNPTYFLFLVGLAGMYALMSLGLNSQWGFSGLINFSVAAFFGIGAYGAALMTSDSSPILGGFDPILGLVVALSVAAVMAVLIGIPTLRLRADYLAIASLGLAEVVRLLVLNERQWTNGSGGVRGIPRFFENWPILSTFPEAMPVIEIAVPRIGFSIPGLFGIIPGLDVVILSGSLIVLDSPFYQMLLNISLATIFVGASYLVLRRAHRSPWGRVLRTIRSDEDLARALGKNTYSFKMQSFVLGSVIMALAGVFYAHLNLFVSPGDLNPITTFYVWVAVILGGSGSNRGALFGGIVVVTIREGTRFLNEFAWIPFDTAPLRLLMIGVLIVLVMKFRPQGILPPQRELIWPDAIAGSETKPERHTNQQTGGDTNE